MAALFDPGFPLKLCRINEVVQFKLESLDFLLPSFDLKKNLLRTELENKSWDFDRIKVSLLTSAGISGSGFDSLLLAAFALGLAGSFMTSAVSVGNLGSSAISTSGTTALFDITSVITSGIFASIVNYSSTTGSSTDGFVGVFLKKFTRELFGASLRGDLWVIFELASAIVVLAAIPLLALVLGADSSLSDGASVVFLGYFLSGESFTVAFLTLLRAWSFLSGDWLDLRSFLSALDLLGDEAGWLEFSGVLSLSYIGVWSNWFVEMKICIINNPLTFL